MRRLMKHLKSMIWAFGLSLCVGCADSIESPAPVAHVPESPWILDGMAESTAAALYASCASCHMADGSGRRDGEVPRLAGQSEKILIDKLQKLRDGKVSLPVMTPFARALTDTELTQVARYISRLPLSTPSVSTPSNQKYDVLPNQNYLAYCAACHGHEGQGNDALLAPKLCGQHANYLDRRMLEIEHQHRGDADTGMISVLTMVNQATRDAISQWLAAGHCARQGANTENKHAS